MINIEWFWGVDTEEVTNKMLGFIEALALEPHDIVAASHSVSVLTGRMSVMMFYTATKRDALVQMMHEQPPRYNSTSKHQLGRTTKQKGDKKK